MITENEALERAFNGWWAENEHAPNNGLATNLPDLRDRLNAAFRADEPPTKYLMDCFHAGIPLRECLARWRLGLEPPTAEIVRPAAFAG